MRGQISFEYLVIVGMAILVIVPALFFFLTFTTGGEDSVSHSRVGEIGSKMLATAADVFALGNNAWLTLDVTLPENVEDIRIEHSAGEDELVITYRTKNGPTRAVFFSNTPLVDAAYPNADPADTADSGLVLEDRAGVVSFRFTSEGNQVRVSVT